MNNYTYNIHIMSDDDLLEEEEKDSEEDPFRVSKNKKGVGFTEADFGEEVGETDLPEDTELDDPEEDGEGEEDSLDAMAEAELGEEEDYGDTDRRDMW